MGEDHLSAQGHYLSALLLLPLPVPLFKPWWHGLPWVSLPLPTRSSLSLMRWL